MAEFRMPSLGADMESAVVTQWLVKPGDKVKRGDVVATVETAKGIIDIEFFDAGVIETLVAPVGQTVPVGGVLASYSSEGRPAADARQPGAEPPTTTPAAPTQAARAPVLPPTAEAAARPVDAGNRLLASPAARKRAAELGVDLAIASPGRPGAAITVGDVERAAAQRATRGAAAATDRGASSAGPMDMRAVIAQAMSRSKREIPHYYLGTTIDMTRSARFVADWNAAHSVTDRLLIGVLLLKAVAVALEKVPELNGFWRNGRFEPSTAINVGAATRLRRGGLVAPALEAANEQPLADLMRQLQGAVERARAGRLRQSELATATITVSSLGERGAETLYPIIHPPQVAIVGFGSIVVRPWCVGGAIVPASVVTATLSADHRVSDGHRGSQFLVEVDRLLQEPDKL